MKRITRREARHILAPMRECFMGMLRTGEAETMDGYAVTRVGDSDSLERTDYCIAGFVALTGRVFPQLDTGALQLVGDTLASQGLVKPADLQACMCVLKDVEGLLLTITRQELSRTIRTAQIMFELEAA